MTLPNAPRALARLVAAVLLLAATGAAAQDIVPIAASLRGAWHAGPCEAPTATLALTARAAARLPADGPARLLRFVAARRDGDWLVGTARGAEAPRLLLRPAGDALETAEPAAKARDDRLPGDAPVTRWHRCAAPPLPLLLLHGEGLAALAALEAVEAVCATRPSGPCAEAVIRAADVSGDAHLGVAEVARLLRGLSWVVAATGEAPPGTLALAAGAGAPAALLAARVLVGSLDYDGDDRLSAAELAQDRAAFAAGGDAAGRPLPLDRAADAAALLRALVEGLLTGATE